MTEISTFEELKVLTEGPEPGGTCRKPLKAQLGARVGGERSHTPLSQTFGITG